MTQCALYLRYRSRIFRLGSFRKRRTGFLNPKLRDSHIYIFRKMCIFFLVHYLYTVRRWGCSSHRFFVFFFFETAFEVRCRASVPENQVVHPHRIPGTRLPHTVDLPFVELHRRSSQKNKQTNESGKKQRTALMVSHSYRVRK